MPFSFFNISWIVRFRHTKSSYKCVQVCYVNTNPILTIRKECNLSDCWKYANDDNEVQKGRIDFRLRAHIILFSYNLLELQRKTHESSPTNAEDVILGITNARHVCKACVSQNSSFAFSTTRSSL